MIYDDLNHLDQYFPVPLANAWKAFLGQASKGMSDGDYPLEAGGVVAKVMRYETKAEAGSRLETHQRNIDVQCVIDGTEGVLWHGAKGLPILQPYDPSGDVAFHPNPGQGLITMELNRGHFVVFFPQDAHAGQLPIGEPGQRIVKVVFKVPTTLLSNCPEGGGTEAESMIP